jgi:hypothetical protein
VTAKGSLEYGGLTVPGATTVATAHGSDNAERARRYVASAAKDPEDCARLLDMLGLVPDGKRLTVTVHP